MKEGTDKQKCWKIKSCSAGLYMICDAYKDNRNRWEIDKPVCCNSNEEDKCLSCFVYEDVGNSVALRS